MPCSRTEYDGLTDTIYTEAVVFDPAQTPKKYQYVDCAVWDTGAQVSIISPRIVKELGLKPASKGMVMGIGGDSDGDSYLIHLGLPNGKIYHNLEVYCSDIDEYDILIGMDVIAMTDFCISHSDKQNTVFSFRYPSEGNAEIK